MFKDLWKLGILVMFLVALAACGGDGGGAADSVPTYSISGTVTGATGVTITLTGQATGTTTTDGSGNYSFSGLMNGNYTVTPSLSGYTFTPTSRAVAVNVANESGINFAATAIVIEVLTTGKLDYPCPMAMCSWDIATSMATVLWGASNTYPEVIVPSHDGSVVAFQGPNLDGIHLFNVTNSTEQQVIFGQIDWTPGCSSWAEDSFDLTQNGDVAVFSSRCFPVGQPEKRDLVVMKTDGSMFWARVTDDTAFDWSPVIGSVGGANDNLTIIFASNKGGEIGIWKQIIDPVNNLLVGPQTLIASNVINSSTSRVVSVNAGYDKIVFAKNVGGVSHIVVKPLAGGAEVDLGQGSDPYWAADGRITYVAGGYLWIVNSDGTGIKQVPTPNNLSGSMGNIIFIP